MLVKRRWMEKGMWPVEGWFLFGRLLLYKRDCGHVYRHSARA